MATRHIERSISRRSAPANGRKGILPLSDRLADWGIPGTIINDFAQHHTILRFQKSAVVFSQGSKSEFLGWVQSGVLEIAYRATNGHSTIMRLVGPGEVFGHQSLVTPDDRVVYAFEIRAHSDCQVAFISRERVIDALQTLAPTVLVRLLQEVSSAWAQTEQYWIRLLSFNYRQRLEMVFADLAARFGTREADGTVLTIEVRHHDLAGIIGCSRPMLSQLIAKLQQAGKISRLKKRYVLHNVKAY
jgi:CRP/FNR family transcriptional regulator, cyclic AMP receptor protein